MSDYLMAGQMSELERLQLQSIVWEPAGERLLTELGSLEGARVVDVGCGCLGWLRLLSAAVGPRGSVVGTDVDDKMLDAAAAIVQREGLTNVTLERDNLFASGLAPRSFDLVHARFEIAPLGRADEQVRAYQALATPGGRLVLEDPDVGTWHFNPPAPAAETLITAIIEAFRDAGGDFDAGRSDMDVLRACGFNPAVRAEVVALPPGHPYLRVPLQFSVSLEPRLLARMTASELGALRRDADAELSDPARWGTTFTLVQTWAPVP